MYIPGALRSVDTGDTYFNEIIKEPVSGNREAKLKLQRERIKGLETYNGQPLEARVEHSRWIVDCPNCNSAEFAFDDKLFFCSLCKNSDIQGKVRKVTIPVERKQIEDILGKRPIINRHWYPNETIKNLESENTKMGVI